MIVEEKESEPTVRETEKLKAEIAEDEQKNLEDQLEPPYCLYRNLDLYNELSNSLRRLYMLAFPALDLYRDEEAAHPSAALNESAPNHCGVSQRPTTGNCSPNPTCTLHLFRRPCPRPTPTSFWAPRPCVLTAEATSTH